MKTSTILTMTALVLVSVFTLLVLNLAPKGPPVTSNAIIPGTDIRGMAVMHKGLSYTLNFDEQRLATEAIARAVEVKKVDYPTVDTNFNFDKLVVYRFNAPDVELLPIHYRENNLVFSVPTLNASAYYLELSGGELKQMINASFDP